VPGHVDSQPRFCILIWTGSPGAPDWLLRRWSGPVQKPTWHRLSQPSLPSSPACRPDRGP